MTTRRRPRDPRVERRERAREPPSRPRPSARSPKTKRSITAAHRPSRTPAPLDVEGDVPNR